MVHQIVFLVLTAILLCPYAAHGQEATEKYIPVGAYPELVGKYIAVGEIVSVDARAKTITLKGKAGVQTFEVTDHTKIWLDRSLLNERNQDGTVSSLKPGLQAEVRVEGPERMRTARWIKLRITASD